VLSLIHFIGFFLLTFIITGFLFYFFKKESIFLDIPNTRSSHNEVIPTAGGLSIVFSFVVLITLMLLYELPNQIYFLLLFSCVSISVLSFIDDFLNLSAKIRIIFQFLITLICIFSLDYFFGVISQIEGVYKLYPLLISLILLLYLVWMTNLYNFMDGINGIAASQSIVTFFALSYFVYNLNFDLFFSLNLGLAFICLGFLPWNFPKARIFMGDTSACFLGLVIGILSIIGHSLDIRIFWCYFIMMSFFIYDATFTLIYRLVRKEKLYEAHKEHLYQLISSTIRSHTKVTLIAFIYNVTWLFPICIFYFFNLLPLSVALLCSLAPIMITFIYTRKFIY